MFFLNLLNTKSTLYQTHIWPYWPYPHYYALLWLLENFQALHSPCFFISYILNVNLCCTHFVSFSLYQLQILTESPLGSNDKTPIKPILKEEVGKSTVITRNLNSFHQLTEQVEKKNQPDQLLSNNYCPWSSFLLRHLV